MPGLLFLANENEIEGIDLPRGSLPVAAIGISAMRRKVAPSSGSSKTTAGGSMGRHSRALPGPPDLTLLPQPFAGQARRDEVRATAFEPQLLAIRLDLDRLPDRLEAEPPRHAIVEQIQVRVFEFHHPPAVDADQMVVRWLVEEVGIVGRLVVAEVDFAQQIRLHQQAQGAVNRRPRGFGIEFAGAVEKLLRGEMLVLGKRRLGDRVTLAGPPQTFAPDEIIEFFLDARVHGAIPSWRNPSQEAETRESTAPSGSRVDHLPVMSLYLRVFLKGWPSFEIVTVPAVRLTNSASMVFPLKSVKDRVFKIHSHFPPEKSSHG